jgi:alkylation response protein AidB-like acyl-CoA dehydrogenase
MPLTIASSEQHLMIQDVLRKYLEAEVAPKVQDIEEGKLPYQVVAKKMVQDFGMLGGGGGGGGSSGDSNDPSAELRKDQTLGMIFAEELGRVSPSMAMAMGVSAGLAGSLIMSKGTPEQKERWGRPILSFDKIGCWALTEPGAGSDAFAMKTTAKKDGDRYILNGSKTFITNAPVADVFVIYAKTGEDPESKKASISTFVFERGHKGIATGKPMKKMGMHGSPTGEIFLDDVIATKENVLGKEKAAREQAMESLVTERSGLPGIALGIMGKCIDVSAKYSNERVQWGQSIGSFQLIQEKLAWMFMMYEATRGMLLALIEKQKLGQRTVKEACAAKLFSSKMSVQVGLEAIQVLGGYGYMEEYKVEMLMRDAKLLEIGAGTSEMQILTIGRELLKEYE